MSTPADIAKPPTLGPADDYHPHLTTGRSASAIVGVLWSSLQTLIPTVSSAVVFFVSAMFLSPADFGLVGLASSIVVSVVAFSPLAFGEALIQRQTLLKSHADSVFWLTTGFGVLAFIPFVFGADLISKLIGDPAIAIILPVLALRIPLDLASAVPNAMIVRSMKFKLIAMRTAVATMVSVVICLTMLVAGFGYWALVGSQVTASLVTCAMAYWVSGWKPGLSVTWAALRDLFGNGAFLSGDRMLSTIKLDHLVLGMFGGTVILGLFLFAQRIFSMLTQLIGGALSSVTFALLSALQDDADKSTQAFEIASFVSAAVSLPMFVALAIVAQDLLAVMLDEKWAGAAFAVQAFSVVGVLAGIGVVQAALIKSQGKPQWWFYYQLVQQTTSVAVILLTYRFGLPTLMIVLMAKTVLFWPVSVAMTARLLKRSAWSYLASFQNPMVATALMASAMIAVPSVFPDLGQATRLGLQLVLAVVIYCPAILLLSRARMRELRRFLPTKGNTTA